MQPARPTSRVAADPAALAQGHRALGSARRWTLISVGLGTLTLGAFLWLDANERFWIPRDSDSPVISLTVLISIAALLLLISAQPAPGDRIWTLERDPSLRPRSPLPSPGLEALVELLEHACARLERGRDDLLDTVYMEYLYSALDHHERAWLEQRGVPRARLFDAASNWAEADHTDDPELCRAIHRELSLILAAIVGHEHEDPYRANLRSSSLLDLIGVRWLVAAARKQNDAMRENHRSGVWIVVGTLLGSWALAVLGALSRVTEPLSICMPGQGYCRSAIGGPQLEFAIVVLVATFPFLLWSVGAAHRLIARRNFAVALPVLAPGQPQADNGPGQPLSRLRHAIQQSSRWLCIVVLPAIALIAALDLLHDAGRVVRGQLWLGYPHTEYAAGALMVTTVAALLLASNRAVHRGHRRLCARVWLAWLRHRCGQDPARAEMLAELVRHRIEIATSLSNRGESLDSITHSLTRAQLGEQAAVLEQLEQARARRYSLDQAQLRALEDTLIACERELAGG
jgi:hypothetical protein